MTPLKSSHDYPRDEEFDYSNCILVRAMEENPEYSSHDFSQIMSLQWYTHTVDLMKLPDEGEDVLAYDHEMLDAPVRYKESVGRETVMANVGDNASQSRTVDVPEDSGIVSPYTKVGRDGDRMDDGLWERCLDNLTQHIEEIDGITTVDYFAEKVKKQANQMRQEPEWQSRPDEIFCRVVEEFAEIHDPSTVEHYRHPSQRSEKPEWLQEQERRSRERGDHLVHSEAEKEEKLHREIDFRARGAEEFTTEEITQP